MIAGSRIKETIGFENEKGEITETIEVDIDPVKYANDINKLRNDIIGAEQAVAALQLSAAEMNDPKLIPDQKFAAFKAANDAYVKALRSLFDLIFGADCTNIIFKNYGDNYAEISAQIFPFIIEKVFPAVKRAVDEQKKTAAAAYKGMRRG